MSSRVGDKVTQKSLTLDDNDQLQLEEFAQRVFKVIKCYLSTEMQGSLNISLNAGFGCGKTTFLRIFESFIRTQTQHNYDLMVIDAWKTDFSRNPLIPLLLEIRKSIKKDQKFSEKIKILLQEWPLIIRMVSIVETYSPSNILIDAEIIRDIKSVLKGVQRIDKFNGRSVLTNFENYQRSIKSMRNAIERKSSKRPIILAIDELDRTRPDYVIQFLETMRHFFDIKGVIFLVAVNKSQIRNSFEYVYGREIDFNSYYQKFFNKEIDLPVI